VWVRVLKGSEEGKEKGIKRKKRRWSRKRWMKKRWNRKRKRERRTIWLLLDSIHRLVCGPQRFGDWICLRPPVIETSSF
jgi:hypothetical protein